MMTNKDKCNTGKEETEKKEERKRKTKTGIRKRETKYV